jgi:hypothetical protein
MRTGTQVCGPDELKVLQQIVNSLWLELRPADRGPELHLRVSRQVVRYAGNDLLDVEGIKRAVRASFKN